MKSTGLFGKNSGRVGGVVYSSYRGEQIVRSYQPQVKNPNTPKQVAQRAKFKLVSQVGASLGKEISLSFVPSVTSETPRNAFIRKMLKKAVYSNNQAGLPIEDIVFTNSSADAFLSLTAREDSGVVGILSPNFNSDDVRVRLVMLGYNEGGEIVAYKTYEPTLEVTENSAAGTVRMFRWEFSEYGLPQDYSSYRVIAYAYEPITTSSATYDDYVVLENDATLTEYKRVYGSNIRFSQSVNKPIIRNV